MPGSCVAGKRGQQRSRLFGVFLAIILLGFTSSCFAAAATVSVHLETPPPGIYMAGERAAFYVELMTSGQFSGPTYFDLPEVDGAIVMQISERPILGSRYIGGETYVTSRYDFILYPQRGGTVQVPALTARFGSKAQFNLPETQHRLTTEPFGVNVKAPPGALPGELILSAAQVSATQNWLPVPAKAVVGDAFTRTITLRAEGVSAMLLPAPVFQAVPGLAIYGKEPQLKDDSGRGVFTGSRVDTVTYLCQREGLITIPELSVRWWNPTTSEWAGKTFPAVLLEIAPNPALVPEPADRGGVRISSAVVRTVTWLAAGALLVLVFSRLVLPRLKQRLTLWLAHRAASEAAHWQQLVKACRHNKAEEVYHELNRWLAIFGRGSPELSMQLPAGSSQVLAEECIKLQQRVIRVGSHWNAKVFLTELTSLRRQLLQKKNQASVQSLPPLNPTGVNRT